MNENVIVAWQPINTSSVAKLARVLKWLAKRMSILIYYDFKPTKRRRKVPIEPSKRFKPATNDEELNVLTKG